MLSKRQPGEHWGRQLAADPYQVMNTEDICQLPVPDIAARDCALFCWATYPMLQDALQVVKAWGFTYKTTAFTWVKENPSGIGYHTGLGYWTRGNPEICLLAVKGKPKRLDKAVRNLIIAPRRQHSRKPDQQYNRIERLVAGPYCELFARGKGRRGWSVWGDEAIP